VVSAIAVKSVMYDAQKVGVLMIIVARCRPASSPIVFASIGLAW